MKIPKLAEDRLVQPRVCLNVAYIGDKGRARSGILGGDVAGNSAGLEKGHVPVLDEGHLAEL